MHDIKWLIAHLDIVTKALDRRGYALDSAALTEAAHVRTSAVRHLEGLREQANQVARQTRSPGESSETRDALIQEGRALKERVHSAGVVANEAETALRTRLLDIPNLPLDSVPDGPTADFGTVLRVVGEPFASSSLSRDHVELGTRLGLLDFDRASKLSGSRFRVARGLGARLERSLAAFLLDLHTRQHGYLEWAVPTLVSSRALIGTGQLPKFEDDLFRVDDSETDLYLIPTGEVPLTNLHARESLPAAELPLAYVAHTPCFRSEAGSYGRDTRGLIRLHEFSKVELVRFCLPEHAAAEFDLLVGHAERALRELGLAYRAVDLPAGDLGFASERTIDLEVWMPHQGTYREISSVSRFGEFQARRADISISTPAGRIRPHTLNGSALPIGRTMAAILEQGQRPDGSVVIPQALAPYFGHDLISVDGVGATQ